MKKILFLLLSTVAMYGQVPADATPLENIQITNNATDNSATKVNVQSTDGTINTISKSDLVNVVEVNDVPTLPLVGEVGKIYVVKNVNKIYRWNGTFYQELAGTDISGLQAQIDLKANNSDVVKLTGNQTISGQKSFSLTGKIDMQTNNGFPAISVTALGSNVNSAAEFINNSSSPYSTALNLQTSLSGGVGNVTLSVLNQSSTGTGIVSNASNGGVSISSQSGNGDSYISNITSGGTGRNYVGRNDGIETYSVDKAGNVIGNSYIKRSTPANNILLAGGGDLDQASLPVSTATQTALNLKANLASPTFTGIPLVPTPTAGTNTTQIATTAFVNGGLATKENAFSKNTAFNKNFGTTVGTIVEGGTLGSNAYTSTAYLPLSGGTVNGSVYFNSTTGGVVSFQTNSLPLALMTSSRNVLGTGSATDFNTYVYGNNPYNIWTNNIKRVTVDGSGNVDFTGTMKMKEYTVATLPTPTGTAYATVTDALAPIYMATVVGGGAIVTPVFFNGSTWVAH